MVGPCPLALGIIRIEDFHHAKESTPRTRPPISMCLLPANRRPKKAAERRSAEQENQGLGRKSVGNCPTRPVAVILIALIRRLPPNVPGVVPPLQKICLD